MPADRESLERLMNVMIRLVDENEGTAQGAFNGLRAMVESRSIDLRELHLTNGLNDLPEAQVELLINKKWLEYKELMRMAYPKEEGLKDEIDRLREEIKTLRSKRQHAETMAMSEAKDKLTEAKETLAEAKATLAEAKLYRKSETTLTSWLKRTLVLVAPSMYTKPMTPDEADTEIRSIDLDVTQTNAVLGREAGEPIEPWMRILLRGWRPIKPVKPKRG